MNLFHMKHALSIMLAIGCVALVIALIDVKHGDNARHDADTADTATFSNKLDTAELDLATYRGSLIIFSNHLNESRATVLEFSNQLAGAQSAVTTGAEQITNLTRQVAAAAADKLALDQRIAGLTNQIAALTQQIGALQANLAETNNLLVEARQQFSLLEDRFRRDVAERVVAERKFNNLHELQAQLESLKKNPAAAISAERIYAGLNVVVQAGGSFHVTVTN